MINIEEHEETFSQLGINKDEANEIVRLFEVLAQIAIDNNIFKKNNYEGKLYNMDKSLNKVSRG